MPRILIIDTYYPDFLKSLPFDDVASYDVELSRVLDYGFGTSDFYSRNLTALGWDCQDVIENSQALQRLWYAEHPGIDPIYFYKPDVVFLQDLSLVTKIVKGDYVLAGQCSCPWPGDDRVRQFDVLFTSFPHYVPRFEALGVKAVYNPLAFEHTILNRIPKQERIHDVVFIGGVGTPSHWKYGMEVLNAVAEAIPTFKWWGYGANLLPSGPLRAAYQGEAWGLDMYRIMSQSKIVLNRHGEVAQQFANNMRMFEATGCGAMLLTEAKMNMPDFFSVWECVEYYSPQGAIELIQYFLNHDSERAEIAANGQQRTLRDHTYAKRMETVSNALNEMLVTA